jgi:hypothetical protein
MRAVRDTAAAEVAEREIESLLDQVPCVSAASFWGPLRSDVNSGWIEHAPFAFWLIEKFRPKVLVELGTHTGYSYCAFCQAVRAAQTETRCYAVDTWRGDEHAGFYKEKIYEELKGYHDDHYSDFSRLVRSSFDEAVSHFDNGSIELIHIDGRHYYEDVLHDFGTWRGKLAPNAIVLFHDTNVMERSFGVHRLWSELRSKHPSFEFLHGHGLGILCAGDRPPEPLRPLFDAGGDARSQTLIREAYARLGEAITDHYRAAAEREAARIARAELDAARADRSVRAEFDAVRAELDGYRTVGAELDTVRAKKASLAGISAGDQHKIEYLRAVLACRTRMLNESQERATQLQERAKQLQKRAMAARRRSSAR